MNDTSIISLDGTDTITITNDYVQDSFDFTFTDNLTITTEVEQVSLTQEKLKKLNALLKVIEDLEDDNPIKECYNAQIMLDKIKGV
jgi:hypothetical protein